MSAPIVERSKAARLPKASKLFRTIKKFVLALLALVLLLVAVILVVANTQDGTVKVLQSYLYWKLDRTANSFTPSTPPTDRVRHDGIRVRTQIKYGTQYPNSFLDIWYENANPRKKRPTVIYMHGGGFFMGSKDWGDPFAGGGKEGSLDGTIAAIARAGLNVVNLDYALAPAHRYPTPLIQLNQAIGYLRAHSAELGLDMDRVFVMGGSAGAQLSAQYGAMLSNPVYAAQVGIKPAIDLARVKGVVLFSAPLKVSGFGWRMNAMMWAYLNTKDLENSTQAKQVDVLSHVNSSYPPTYITDGNQPDTFPDHAKAMARLLNQKHVDHVFNYYQPGEAKLDHGYTDRLHTKEGRQNLERAIAFMRERSR